LLKKLALDHKKVLYPNKLKFLDKLTPLATAKELLNPEKLPGP